MSPNYDAPITRLTEYARLYRARVAGLARLGAVASLLFALPLAACRQEPMPERTPDTSRPRLTQERIARVVQVSEQLRPHHLDIADYLDQGDIGTGYDFVDNRMMPTLNLVGPDGMVALVAMREDPAAYARDVFWMRVISSAVRGSGSVDQKMREIHEAKRSMAGTAIFSPGIRALRNELHTLLLLHARIGRGEEAAVRARMADIHRVTFIPQQLRAAAFRDSVLRDSIRRAARGR